VPRHLRILQTKTVGKITKDGRFIGVNWTYITALKPQFVNRQKQ